MKARKQQEEAVGVAGVPMGEAGEVLRCLEGWVEEPGLVLLEGCPLSQRGRAALVTCGFRASRMPLFFHFPVDAPLPLGSSLPTSMAATF